MATTRSTAFALILALTAPVSAQTAAEPPAAAEGEAPATGTTPDGLSMGTAASGDVAAVGQSYIAAAFDAWEQRCMRTEINADPCVLYSLLKNEQGDSVAEFSVFGLPKGTEGPAVAGANFIAPLETLLTAGLSMRIDSGEAKTYPFSVCTTTGCVARLGFTAAEVDAMKKGANVTFVLVPFAAPDARVELNMSLKGFTAGMNAVDAANDAADAAAAEAGAAAAPAGGEAAPAPEGGEAAPAP